MELYIRLLDLGPVILFQNAVKKNEVAVKTEVDIFCYRVRLYRNIKYRKVVAYSLFIGS